MISGIAWAGSAIITRIMRRDLDFDVVSVTTWQMIYGVGPLIIISILVPSSPIQRIPAFSAALLNNIL